MKGIIVDSDTWGNVVAFMGVIIPALIFWVTIARDRKNDLARLADLSGVRDAICGKDSDIHEQVKVQIDESIRVLTARVAFREYGRIKGKKIANVSLPKKFIVPILGLALIYIVSALGIVVTSVWNPALWGHDVKFWVFVCFFTAMFALVAMALGGLVRQNVILREFEAALQDGKEEEFLSRFAH